MLQPLPVRKPTGPSLGEWAPKAVVRRLCRMLGAVLGLLLSVASAPSGSTVQWMQGGHGGTINAVAFSPDGTLVLSASDDATVKLWSTNGTLLRTLSTHPYQVTALAISPDGTRLAAGVYSGGYQSVSGQPIGGLGRVFLWESADGWTNGSISLLRTTTNHLAKITALAFSTDGTRLASGGAEGSNVVQSVATGAVLTRRAAYSTAEGPSILWDVAFSSGGLMASACEDGTIQVWNDVGSLVWSTNRIHAGDVAAVAFSPDGSRLVSAGADATIRIWSTSNWSCLNTLTNHAADVTALAFAPDGARLASASLDRTIRVWDPVAGVRLATAVGHAAGVTCVALSPDGHSIISGGLDHTVRLWSAADGQPLQTFTGHTDLVKSATLSPDGALAATAANDGTVYVRRLLDGAPVFQFTGHTGCVSAVAFAPDSRRLATAGGPLDPTIKLWSMNDGTIIRTIPAGSNGVTALAFSADGALLASGGDVGEQCIQLWNANTGQWLQTFSGHSNGVTALAFCPRDRRLVSGGRGADNKVKVWTPSNSIPLRTFPGHAHAVEAVAFSPDGDHVASGSSGANALRIHRVSDGTSQSLGAETNCVFFVAFSPDGTTLASAGREGIKLWNVASGTFLETRSLETLRASCFAYSPNGHLTLHGREDGTVVVSENALGVCGQDPLAFLSLAVEGDGATRMEAAVQPLTCYVIEASTNLVDWSYFTQAVSETNTAPIRETGFEAHSSRFYRGLTPP